MSVNSMANAAAARRPDMVPIDKVPTSLDQIAKAASTPPSTTAATPPPAQSGQPATAVSTPADTTFNVLFGYIPTEVLTLYVAALAAVQQVGNVTSTNWLAFGIFLFATPVIVWLVYAAKLKNLQKALPLNFGAWPVWEMFAATAAYTAWAFALPKSPFSEYGWYSSALSGLAVLVVSTLLGLLAPFFQRPLST
jgi:hypothetical protein